MIRKLLLASAAVCMFGAAANAANTLTVGQLGALNLSTTTQSAGLSGQSNMLTSTQIGVGVGSSATATQTGIAVNTATVNQASFLGAVNVGAVTQVGLINQLVAHQCTNALTC